MVEVKSVKVDNWGVFFLQKLQNFFNKTDYCDLTLQFKDNSQLKVHRLVLSACTDFFNVLESKYNVTDDILIMPRDLQADVVVPIVNFMYTGTLEFEVNMYARLLKTAKDMNMTVLLKLLEAHKRTVGEASRTQAPVVLNKGANQKVSTYSKPAASTAQRTYTPRRQTITKTSPQPRAQYSPVITKVKAEKISPSTSTTVVRTMPSTSSYLRKNLPEPVQLVAKYANSPASTTMRGPSRFESDDTTLPDTFESSFDNISYESKPLITASQLIKEEKDSEYDKASTSFEKLKRGYTGPIKRPHSGSLQSPPEKKPNIQDVKEYTEAHRMREKIVAEEIEEEGEYYAEDFQHSNDDDDDDEQAENSGSSVVIKSDGNSPVNHAKIISEVLKKYPHLVKNNKNIKLKIMQKGNTPVTVAAISKDTARPTPTRGRPPSASQPAKIQAARPSTSRGPQAGKVAPATSAITAASTTASPANQPKKIDSRTMHALIAKGAENTTGPWLCLECGVNGRPISIPSYKGFRRHLINIHKQKIDSRLCEHCGWRSTTRADLHHHILIKHNIKPPNDLHFPKCGLCNFIGLDQSAIRKHKEEEHQQHSSQQHCIYCNKTFPKEILLYAHMRSNHKERAQEDGVMDFSDEEMYDDTDKYVPNHPEMEQATGSGGSDNKIKVLSNIALPSKSPYVIDASTGVLLQATENINLEPSSEAEGLSNVASGIATSLGVLEHDSAQMHDSEAYHDDSGDLESGHYIEAAMANVHGETMSPSKEDEGTEVVTKFITEEGSELQLTASERAKLLAQLQGQGEGITDGVVMVLNDTSFEQQSGEEIMNAEGNDNIVLVYDEQQQQSNDNSATEAADDSKDQSGEWQEEDSQKSEDENSNTAAEKTTSADNDDKKSDSDTATEDKNKDTTKKESKNNLISDLEGDWSDEEDEDATKKTEKKDDSTDDDQVLVSTVTENKEQPSKANKPLPKIVDDLYDSSSNSSSNGTSTKKESVKEQKSSDKKLSNLLADWDSQPSEKFGEEGEENAEQKNSDSDSKKSKNGNGNGKSGKNEEKKSVKNTNEKKKDVTDTPQANEKKAKPAAAAATKDEKNEKKPEQKAEIKTLINDWEDENEF